MQLLLLFIIVAVLSPLFFLPVVVNSVLTAFVLFLFRYQGTVTCGVPMFSTVPLLLLNPYLYYYFCSCTVALRAVILLYPQTCTGLYPGGRCPSGAAVSASVPA